MPTRILQRTVFAGDSPMAYLLSEHDWSTSSLGPPVNWPPALRYTVELMLGSKFPMFVLWGEDHACIYNDSYIPMLGPRHPEAVGRAFGQIWPEIWPEIGPLVGRALGGESTFFEDLPLTLERFGYPEQCWFTFSYSPLRDTQGDIRGLFCAAVETSAKMRADLRARASEERTRLALETTDTIGTWDWDVASKLVMCDERFAAMFGITGEQARKGAPLDTFVQAVHIDDRDGLIAAIERAVVDGSEFAHEYRLVQRDGSVRWLFARGRCLYAEDGAPLRFPGVGIDISAQKRVEASLHRMNRELGGQVAQSTRERNRLWNMSQDILAVASLAGYYVSVNPGFTAILGWSEDEATAVPFAEFIDPRDLALVNEKLAQLGAGIPLKNFELNMRHKEGGVRRIAWNAEPEGDLLYVAGRDVTAAFEQAQALQRAEEALRHSQKMESLGQLTGGIAHDFNNLLQGISGPLELIRRYIDLGRGSEAIRFIDMATRSSVRAAGLTHRLLAFSRRQPLAPRTVDVGGLVGSVIDLLRNTTGEAVVIDVDVAPGTWHTRCDANQLENALLNLAINARDAMPAGGRLTLSTRNVRLDAGFAQQHPSLSSGDFVHIAVTDTGDGMSADVRERAFEPFFTTKPLGQGTGLGLSMTYGFVKQSGGTATIDSRPGAGCTINLFLPRHDGELEATPAPLMPSAAAAAPRHAKRVLVVEDDSVVRNLVREVLTEFHCCVLEAADGPAGLALAVANEDIDLLITDVGLPGLNGRQLADAVRTQRPALPILFMTGYAEVAAGREGFMEPGMELITKPFDLRVLAARIAQMLAATGP